MRKLIACCMLCIMISGCMVTHFARTKNIPNRPERTLEEVDLYVNEDPTRPYEMIGIITVDPLTSNDAHLPLLHHVFKRFRKRAAKEGADAVIRLRTTRDYHIHMDAQQLSLYTDTQYYGDAIVYLNDESESGDVP